jgi:hypothetical protein
LIGKVYEDFENIANWNDIAANSKSSGIDATKTKMWMYKKPIISGMYAGRLDYTFTGSNGMIALSNTGNYNLIKDNNTEIGVWIFGDLSYHKVSFIFTNTQSQEAEVETTAIDWAGWKFISTKVQNSKLTGDILFKGIIIRQEAKGLTTGTIYLDDLTGNFKPVGIETEVNNPKIFSITCFPNPVKDRISFEFNIPWRAEVSICIYSFDGKLVNSLFSETLNKGKYLKSWEKSLPNGCYIYRFLVNGLNEKNKQLVKVGQIFVLE